MRSGGPRSTGACADCRRSSFGLSAARGCAPRARPTRASAAPAAAAGRRGRSGSRSGLWKSLPREASRPNSRAVSAYFTTSAALCAPVTHLDAAPAVRLELGEQRVLLGWRELVARRVGDHREAAGAADPATPRRAAWPSGAARSRACLRSGSGGTPRACRRRRRLLDQEAREVRARDHLRVAGVLQRAFVGAADAHRAQRVAHLARARLAAAARARPGRRAARRRLDRSRGRRYAPSCRRS